ncbi:MAG: phage tail tip lysozyme, partial [Alphaproteobacteria bacterium]|nr:phage tail tip lysozyme [Alphaproteobacteria bacterium]
MADNSSHVIREYLISIGYKVDDLGERKARDSVEGMDKNVEQLSTSLSGKDSDGTTRTGGKSLVASAIAARDALLRFRKIGLIITGVVGTTTIAMVTFGKSMAELFHSAQRGNTTAKALDVLGHGFKQIGLDADTARASIAQFYSGLISDPAKRYFIQSLGVDVNQDSVTAYLQLVERLNAVPDRTLRSALAQRAGIDPGDLEYLRKNWDQLNEAVALYQQRLSESQTNIDKMAEGGKKFDTIWNNLTKSVELLSNAIRFRLATDFAFLFKGLESGFVKLAERINSLGIFRGILSHIVAAMKATERDAMNTDIRPAINNWINEFNASTLPKDGPSPEGPSPEELEDRVHPVNVLKLYGYSDTVSRGIVSALQKESGQNLDPKAFNPAGGGKGAKGIAQWRGSRQDEFKSLFGRDVLKGSQLEQIYFLDKELRDTNLGAMLLEQRFDNPKDVEALMHRFY